MNPLEGVWKLAGGQAWDENGKELPPPYGDDAMGTLIVNSGRLMFALCRGDAVLPPGTNRSYSSYGGPYTFDGKKLETTVDIASDPTRIGGSQVRDVELKGEQMILRPPMRGYGGKVEQRIVVWNRIWKAS